MAKPNVACPKCHGTGWEDKSGTLRSHPCPDCSRGQPMLVEQMDEFPKLDEEVFPET